uniref:Uncharacterized protein n=1 Tax=Romanomermis culicivorax TaxID=13658 RepID=A0A915IQP7_ROMCU
MVKMLPKTEKISIGGKINLKAKFSNLQQRRCPRGVSVVTTSLRHFIKNTNRYQLLGTIITGASFRQYSCTLRRAEKQSYYTKRMYTLESGNQVPTAPCCPKKLTIRQYIAPKALSHNNPTTG